MKILDILEDQTDQPDLIQAFKDFLPLAMKELDLSQLPPIKIRTKNRTKKSAHLWTVSRKGTGDLSWYKK